MARCVQNAVRRLITAAALVVAPASAVRADVLDTLSPASRARKKARGLGYLLGDWGGLRTDMIDAGITPTIDYKIESVWNPRGGTRAKAATVGQLDLGLRFDTGRLVSGDGGVVQLTVTRRHGHSVARSGQRGFYLRGQQQLGGVAAIDPVTNILTPARGATVGFNYVHGDRRSATILDDLSFEALWPAPVRSCASTMPALRSRCAV